LAGSADTGQVFFQKKLLQLILEAPNLEIVLQGYIITIVMHFSHNGKITNVDGAILAGGASKRMGHDKATLKIGTLTLFERVRRAMETLFERVLIAGGRPDLASAAVPAFGDTFPGSSLGGLHTAMKAAERDWVCVLPCDLPFPSVALLHTLLESRNGVEAVVPRHDGGTEPLVACYRRDLLPIVQTQLETGRYRITDFLQQIDVHYVDPDRLPSEWRRALVNLNSPADLARLTQPPPVVTVVARSGTGKTTLIEKLIAALSERGWTIGALKHDAHRFDIDHEGKDTWRLTRAGAVVTGISSATKSAIIRRHDLEPPVEEVLAKDFMGVDLVITEGFKQSRLPKIEVHRQSLNQPLLCRNGHHDSSLLAVASDAAIEADVPVFDLDKPNELVAFLEGTFLT